MLTHSTGELASSILGSCTDCVECAMHSCGILAASGSGPTGPAPCQGASGEVLRAVHGAPRPSAAAPKELLRAPTKRDERPQEELPQGLWGVECILAVIGTVGPVKRSKTTSYYPML
eukprot:1798876-Pyramimonas_sp.AAC.1